MKRDFQYNKQRQTISNNKIINDLNKLITRQYDCKINKYSFE